MKEEAQAYLEALHRMQLMWLTRGPLDTYHLCAIFDYCDSDAHFMGTLCLQFHDDLKEAVMARFGYTMPIQRALEAVLRINYIPYEKGRYTSADAYAARISLINDIIKLAEERLNDVS